MESDPAVCHWHPVTRRLATHPAPYHLQANFELKLRDKDGCISFLEVCLRGQGWGRHALSRRPHCCLVLAVQETAQGHERNLAAAATAGGDARERGLVADYGAQLGGKNERIASLEVRVRGW